MAVDPVCGVHVDDKAAELTDQYVSLYGGESFYFCSEDCQRKFEETPEHYARETA